MQAHHSYRPQNTWDHSVWHARVIIIVLESSPLSTVSKSIANWVAGNENWLATTIFWSLIFHNLATLHHHHHYTTAATIPLHHHYHYHYTPTITTTTTPPSPLYHHYHYTTILSPSLPLPLYPYHYHYHCTTTGLNLHYDKNSLDSFSVKSNNIILWILNRYKSGIEALTVLFADFRQCKTTTAASKHMLPKTNTNVGIKISSNMSENRNKVHYITILLHNYCKLII